MAKFLVASCLMVFFVAFLAFKIFASNYPQEVPFNDFLADLGGVPFPNFLNNGYEGPSGDNNIHFL